MLNEHWATMKKKYFFKKLIHYSTTLTLINASDTSLYGILTAPRYF